MWDLIVSVPDHWLSFYFELSRCEYFDKRFLSQDLAQEVTKCHLSLVEALPRSKFRLIRHQTVCVGCPRTVREKCPQPFNRLEYFDKRLHTHWYWKDLAQEIENYIYHRSRLCRAPNSEKLKMIISLEPNIILWWNFACTLILTRCGRRDCQMPFVISRGFAEFQIQKMALSLEPLEYVYKILHTHLLLTRSIYRDFQVPFIISRGYAEVEILNSRGYAEVEILKMYNWNGHYNFSYVTLLQT